MAITLLELWLLICCAANIYAAITNLRWARKHYEAQRKCQALADRMVRQMWGQDVPPLK